MKYVSNLNIIRGYSSFSIVFIIAIFTAIMGEFKIYPIHDSIFRIGLGSVTFFFLLLLMNAKPLITGFVTGIIVFLFRISIDLFLLNESFYSSFITNIPGAIFYIILAICLHKVSLRKLKEFPLQLGLFGAFFELVANCVEQLLYVLLINSSFFNWRQFILLTIVALLRSFFVIGIYSSIIMKQQQQKLHEMFTMQTNLYKETLYMQQTTQLIEQVTADSFSLYTKLRATNHGLSTESLRIASEMHEVKKNTQRVVAGLSNLMDEQETTMYSLTQLLSYVINTHIQYSRYLNKFIEFQSIGQTNFYTKHYLAILSILNNLLSNAVEAIEQNGHITIQIEETENELSLMVMNDGPTIKPYNLEVLFDAGFTTKFDANGNASTGIGLYHVKSIVESLNGSINVESNEITTFHIRFNKQSL